MFCTVPEYEFYRRLKLRKSLNSRPRETVTINSFASDADALNRLYEVNKNHWRRYISIEKSHYHSVMETSFITHQTIIIIKINKNNNLYVQFNSTILTNVWFGVRSFLFYICGGASH